MDIFRSVQEEYEYEGILLGEVTAFSDNSDVLNLVEGKLGIIAVLNEECVRPNGNDLAFVSKIKSLNKESSCLISDRLHLPSEFGIDHYAGMVKYDASFFVEKNADRLPRELVNCAMGSTNDLIRDEVKGAADAREASSASAQGGGIGGGGGKMKKGSTPTVGTKFRSQLTSLMRSLGKTRTR